MSRPKKNESLDKLRGQRVKESREKNNLTIEELAEKVDKDTTTQSKRESGERGFKEEDAKKYAEILGVPFEYIMGYDSKPFSEIKDRRFVDDSPLRKTDALIVRMIESMGFKLRFIYVPQYNQEFEYSHSDTWGDTKTPKEFETTFDCIDTENFSFVEPKCVLIQKYGKKEEYQKEEKTGTRIILKRVFFNDSLLTFGEFAYFMIELQNSIFDYSSNIPQKQNNIKEYLTNMDSDIEEEIVKSNSMVEIVTLQKYGKYKELPKEIEQVKKEISSQRQEREERKDKKILEQYNKYKEQGKNDKAMNFYNDYIEEKYFVLNKVWRLIYTYNDKEKALKTFDDFFDE